MQYSVLESGGFQKTQGAVWPLPQMQKNYDGQVILQPKNFNFKVTAKTCGILESALTRYYSLTFNPPRLPKLHHNVNKVLTENTDKYAGSVSVLEVQLSSPCEDWPSSSMDEQYTLRVNSDDMPGRALLFSQSIWGVLRGLETFSQLVYRNEDGLFLINSTMIRDFPRFSHRGILVDTARHFIPKRVLMEQLEAMAQNKLNVLHWHIVDDQSFPYESKTFPSLSAQGAYNRYTHVYPLEDIAEIIEFARLRGIRVIPEFDSPGHTLSWGNAMTTLLTPCYKNVSGKLVPNGFGPVNPILESTYKFLKQFFTEVVHVFPEKFVHLGGDEVSFACWKSNPDILKFMDKMGYGQNFAKLEEYYMQRLLDIVKALPGNNSYVIWQEVIDNGATLKPDTIVQVWKTPYDKEMAFVTSKGYRTLLSTCWYLDYISYGSDWKTYYACEPHNFNGTDAQKKLVFGGEACLWSEFVDATNLIARMWPRASAPAERLWSNKSVNSTSAAAPRLEEHRCRMLQRGINAQPQNGPSFCDVDFRLS